MEICRKESVHGLLVAVAQIMQQSSPRFSNVGLNSYYSMYKRWVFTATEGLVQVAGRRRRLYVGTAGSLQCRALTAPRKRCDAPRKSVAIRCCAFSTIGMYAYRSLAAGPSHDDWWSRRPLLTHPCILGLLALPRHKPHRTTST